MDPCLLVRAAPFISRPLTHIFNLTVSTGILHVHLASCKLCMCSLFKMEETLEYLIIIDLFQSCLAWLKFCSLNRQLCSFLTECSLLNKYQSGFRPGHSTITAATLAVDDIVKSLDAKLTCVLFIYLSKAF